MTPPRRENRFRGARTAARVGREPGVPVPLYAFPRTEVRDELLRPARNPATGTHTGSQVFYDLFETGLATRYYIPREDVRPDLFEATDHNEAVDITRDGDRVERPVTHFTGTLAQHRPVRTPR